MKTGGRQKGVGNKTTNEVRALAQKHGPEAIKRLATLMKSAESEQAQVSACKEILDRAYGKAPQHNTNEHDVSDPMAALLASIASPVFPKKDDNIHDD